MKNNFLIYDLGLKLLSDEEINNCIMSAYNKLSQTDKKQIAEIETAAMHKIKNVGLTSSRDLIAKIGMRIAAGDSNDN